ncbi:unnamed protein product [Closterium sp. NIES-65]|nr:unnamed protein product [Closterium sp. NIES-65]
MQLQGHPRVSLTPQQLCEWYASWGCRGGSSGSRPGVGSSGASCSGPVQQQRRPRETLSPQQLREWYAQSRGSVSSARCPYVISTGVWIGAGEAAALGASASAAPGPGEAAALGADVPAASGACESAPSGTASTEALHTFTLDLGTSRCFFCDRTALEQLPRPVVVSLALPSRGPALATSTTALPCPAVLSGTLSGLYLPSFSTNLVAGSALEDVGVHQLTPAYEHVTHCTCAETGRHLATFTRQPGSDLYTLTTESPQVTASASASGQLSLPPLPPSPAPPCLPYVEGRQRATPHSSEFPSTVAPLQTLHMDVWGPARVCGQGGECYFLLVVDDYTRYTTFYHPTSRRVFPSQDVTFDKSVTFYRLFPYRTAPLPPPSLFLTPGAASVDPLPPRGPAPSGVSQVDPVEPVEVALDSGPARGTEHAEPERAEPERAELERAGSGGTTTGGAEPGGAETGGPEPGGAETAGAEPGGAETGGMREWYSRYCRRRRGVVGAGGAAGAAGGSGAAGAAGGAAGTGAGAAGSTSAAGGAASAGPVGGATGAAGGIGAAGGAERVGAAAGGSGDVSAGSGGTSRPQPYFVPLLQQVLGQPPPPCPAPSLKCPPPVQSLSQLPPASPLPSPSPYTGPIGGLTERRELESRPLSPKSRSASPVRAARTGRRVPRQRPPAVLGTHQKALCPSTAPQHVPLSSPPASSLPALADPESDSLRAASPTVTHLLATAVTDPSFESAVASALVAELVDLAAHCRLDYATSLVAESGSESVYPPSVGGECALGTDVLEDRQEEFECFAAATAMDAEMASWKSTGTYVDEVPPPGANIINGMWIFKVKRPPGSPPVFKARYVARGFSQREGIDFFQTFSPTLKMTTLWVLLHVAAPRDYELHSLDFSTAFLQGNLHEEIWLRRPPSFTGSFPPSTQWSLRRPVYGLRQVPREWHDTLRTTFAALGFAPSTADPSLFPRTDTSLPPLYIPVYVDDLVFATANTEALALVKLELQKRHTCTDLGELRSYLGLHIT